MCVKISVDGREAWGFRDIINTGELFTFWYIYHDWPVLILQNDPNKQTNMPTDGTVHELTSNVSIFSFFNSLPSVQ